MVVHATIRGEISYTNKENFAKDIKTLTDGGWLIGNNFVDECQNVIEDDSEDIDHDNMVINIPYALHRNLLGQLIKLSPDNGQIVSASTDGVFSGYIDTWSNGKHKSEHYDLEEWAEENGLSFDDYKDESFDEHDNTLYWMNDVVDEFVII